MSSYLLLRNNKESGPFTIDEIKGMSLKAYDLLWVVGKSAAWRYPGEIAEIKAFAPPVPEQITDIHRVGKTDSSITTSRETNIQKSSSAKMVYVNFPSEKKQLVAHRETIVNDLEFSEKITSAERNETAYDFSDLYKKKQNGPIRFSGRILWISTVILLFGAGLLTGFFISDRRKFFSQDEIHPQNAHQEQTILQTNKKEPASPGTSYNSVVGSETSASTVPDPLKTTSPLLKKTTGDKTRKNSIKNTSNKDSIVSQYPIVSPPDLKDSLKKNERIKSEMLIEKIKTHPEDYIDLVTGRYTTGVFGGISSFPVTVTNTSSIVLDQVIISIDYIQNNGKIFKTESLGFTTVEPGETVTLKAPKSPRGVKIATHIHIEHSNPPDKSNPN